MENTNKWKNIAFHYLNVHFHFCILFFWLILGYNFRFTLLCEERKGYPFQYSGLEKSKDYIVHGVAKSWTWLSDFHFTLFLTLLWVAQFSSVTQLCPILRPHGLQHARLPCPSPTPRDCSNSCLLSRWCHPTISSSVGLFSCFQSFPTSGSGKMSQFFSSGGQSFGVSASASVLPMNPQDWSPLGWTGWISLQSKGLSRVFSNTIVQKQQFFSAQLSL